jgi:exopolyphosphatase/guanosine-5'-triphosphate,3'-diphosphate pyrophosphatase
MRIAAIDIGTNSIHIVIAQATGQGGFDVLDREREVVQVGRGSFKSGRLRPDAIARTADALARFVALAKSLGADRIACTATAAVREAKNGGDFVRAARDASGITPRIIPAKEEGRLIYLAVKNALELPEKPSLIVDIGGGSIQLVVGTRAGLEGVASAPLGALRLSETHPLGDPPDAKTVAALKKHIRKTAKPMLKALGLDDPAEVYGSSGSIHALAHVANALDGKDPIRQLNGHRLTLKALDRCVAHLAALPLAERAKLTGIDAARAEIIVHGALVLRHVLEAVGADGILISDFGVREGLLADTIAKNLEMVRLEREPDLKLRSVFEMLAKFRGDETHARHVADLALALYDGLQRDHDLAAPVRTLLHYAALLHDIGSVIGHDSHTEHSHYIIRHGNLRGLSAEEIEFVSLVARYHGKAKPRKSDPAFAVMGKAERKAVRWSAAILRIAEALDRSQYQLVKTVSVTRPSGAVVLRVASREDARLEIWAARQRTGLLEDLLDRRVRVAPERRADPRRASGRSAPGRNGGAPRARRPVARAPRPSPGGRARSPSARDGSPTRAPRRRPGSSPAKSGARAGARNGRGPSPARSTRGTRPRSGPS